MTSSSTVVQHADNGRSLVTRHIGGETLIVPVTSHVTDLESIYVLNDVGSRIWELLRSPITAESIATIVASEFTVSPEHAVADVTEFLDSLAARGLIKQMAESAS